MKIKILPMLLICMAAVCSCSTENIAYMEKNTGSSANITENFDARIKVKDLLTISVTCSQPEIASPFNLTVSNPTPNRIGSSYTVTQPTLLPYQVDNELVDRYFAMVLSRHNLFTVKTIGLTDTLSFAGYCFCGLTVAFLLLMGMSAAPLVSARSAELGVTLRARGFGPLRQVLGEFVSFYLLILLASAAAGAAAWFFLRRSALVIPELADLSPAAAASFAVSGLIPPSTSNSHSSPRSSIQPRMILILSSMSSMKD